MNENSKLTPEQRAEFELLDKRINEWMAKDSTRKMLKALIEIRDSKTYEATEFKTFDAFCLHHVKMDGRTVSLLATGKTGDDQL